MNRRAELHAEHRSLPGPDDIHREVLPNGMVVLARSNFSSPSVTISGYIPAGSLLDPDDKLGLADFVASALLRGTQQHTFDELYNELESVGASLGFDSGMTSTGFHGHGLAEDLGLLLGLLAEAAREPSFPRAEVEKLRHHLLTGLAIREQDTADMADITFDEILYKDHPYGRDEDGNPTTIRAITRADLVRFHHRAFGPRGTTVVVVGAVEPKRAVSLVRRAFGDWKNPGQVELPNVGDPKRLTQTVRRHHPIPGKSQSDLVIGTNGPRRRDPDYLAAALGNSVLGQFGMMGRIGKAVRERSGLAYYAYSNLSSGLGPGSWTVSAGVNPANVEKATEIIVKEFRRFVRQPVSAEELADSQANFIGRLPLSFESNAGVATALINMERHQLGLDYYRQYDSRVRAVTREQLLEAARKYIDPQRLAIAVAGPQGKEP
jgi:zinc protease